MAQKFKIGDRVQSKGIAGPVMLVFDVLDATDKPSIRTFWFSGKKKEISIFHADTLEIAPDAPV